MKKVKYLLLIGVSLLFIGCGSAGNSNSNINVASSGDEITNNNGGFSKSFKKEDSHFFVVSGGSSLISDLAEWKSQVSDIESFLTIADNILLADEVSTLPGVNEKLGSMLTYQAINTGLSFGFVIETLQDGAGFTFSESESGTPQLGFEDALSVGDIDDYEDDDWQLSLLDGATMMAFGIEIRHSRFAPGESITLYSNNESVAVIDLGALPETGNGDYFIGIISDVPFDKIGFNEDPDGDDIAIADMLFAKVIDDNIPLTLDPVANKNTLWPPNHKMVDIIIEANALQEDGLPVTLTATVSSNEPENGTGDGNTAPDWTEPAIDQDNGIISLQLRSERSGGGDGRVYAITINATDESGNTCTVIVEILVPHDK